MDKQENLFGEYITDNTIKGRVKNPKTWVNLLILIVIIAMAVVLIQSVRGSWTKSEIKKSIQILDFSSKWVIKNAGFIGDGSKREVSIIPQITFKVKNIGNRELEFVRFIGNFVYAEKRALSIGDGYSDVLKNSSLAPGDTSELITIKSTYGYKSTTNFNEDYKDMFFNKKGWKRFNVRVSARVKGTVKELAEFPVEDRIEDGFSIRDKGNITRQVEEANLLKTLGIIDYKSEWKRVDKAKGNLFIPTIVLKLKNSGEKDIVDLLVSVSFEFDDKKGVISQWKGKKSVLIDLLSVEGVSDELSFEAENGVKASSVEKLFLNKVEWEDTEVKIFIGTKKLKPFLLKKLNVGQNVKGYKVRERVIR